MTRYLALWPEPEDVDGFETEYTRDHLPLAEQLPGVGRIAAVKAVDGDFYRIAELEFESIDALRTAFGESTQGQRLIENSRHLQNTYGVQVKRLILDS